MLLDDGENLSVDAPIGFIFAGICTHNISMDLFGWKRSDAYKVLSDDLQLGLKECNDHECENCIHAPMTFDELHELYGGERLS